MSFTVGLDFGTHQSKVCVENATNPAQKLYEFVEFKSSNGKTTVLFPSIVQINNDDTVSYGFVDNTKCKTSLNETMLKPNLELLTEPILELIDKPIKPKYPNKPLTEEKNKKLSWKEQLQQLKSKNIQNKNSILQNWKEECKKIDNRYEEALNLWEEKIKIKKKGYNREIEFWKNKNYDLKKEYDNKIKEWENNSREKLQYRYFKLASFSNSIKWNHQISSDIISVWYTAYIIFILQEKLGNEFFLQMGIPSDINATTLDIQKQKAYNILIAAYKLVDLYETKKAFLSEKFTVLLELTELNKHSKPDIDLYGLNVLPEAFAGLSSITQQKRLETGMNLLIDIGGGTTDVAFFTITENHLPNIHSVISFPKGLNFIFENYTYQNKGVSISDVQALFFANKGEKSLFDKDINEYKKQLIKEVTHMVESIENSFTLRENFHGLNISRLREALKKRPVIFCGGGSLYKTMRTSVLNFTDIKLINKNLLNIPTVINQNIEEKLFTILATSYGLSIPLENEIKLTPIEEVFNHLEAPATEKWDYGYEHGLSDF